MTPEISVLVPVYNAEKHLPACLKSLFAQTFANFEIVCLDDGSTDGSARALNSFAARDARLRVVRQTNAGVSAARNRLMRLARGKYIAFVDADDWVHPSYLEKLYRLAVETGADITRCAFQRYNLHARRWERPAEARRRRPVPDSSAGRLKSAWNDSVVWAKLYRKSFIERENLLFLEGQVAEDFGFCVLSFALANRVATLNEELYVYCVAVAGSITADWIKQNLGEVYNALYICEEFERRGLLTGGTSNRLAGYVLHASARLRHLPVSARQRGMQALARVKPCLVRLKKFCALPGRLRVGLFLRLAGRPGTKRFYFLARALR